MMGSLGKEVAEKKVVKRGLPASALSYLCSRDTICLFPFLWY